MFNAEYITTETYDNKLSAFFGILIYKLKGYSIKDTKINENKKVKITYSNKFKIFL